MEIESRDRLKIEDLGLAQKGWSTPERATLESALDFALDSLANANLAEYYSVTTNYAGASFASMEPNDPFDITAADLHALRLLSVSVKPGATRRLLADGPLRTAVLKALAQVPPDVRLATCSRGDLEAASALHDAVYEALKRPGKESHPWVTASKLTARKRPALIPVRDNVVGTALGKDALQRRSVYWQIMRFLLRNDAVALAIHRARLSIEQVAGVKTDPSDLRFLDAALWMQAVLPSSLRSGEGG